MTDRLAYRVPEVCAMLGISKSLFYKRVAAGQIPLTKLGSVSLVTRESLDRLIGAPPGAPPDLAKDAGRRTATGGDGRGR